MFAILRPLLRYADFSGRASRAEYWLFGFFQTILIGFMLFLSVLALAGLKENAAQAMGGFFLGLGLTALIVLGFFVPNLAVTVRRLHDINLSGWWMALMLPSFFAQSANILTGIQAAKRLSGGSGSDLVSQAMFTSLIASSPLMMIAGLCSLALFIMMVMAGTKGANRFGDDPKDGGGTPSRRPALDEARIDAAIADLKAEKPYKPIFDFGPGSEGKPMIAERPAPVTQAAAPQVPAYGSVAARPTFGRRR
jgi:uncharacterized membrane protein YhaH (DUF805 family)